LIVFPILEGILLQSGEPISLHSEENPVLEIRSKLGKITQWETGHSKIARALYAALLELLNLAKGITDGTLSQLQTLDVEIDVDGRHIVCANSSIPYINYACLISKRL